jgi:hypothetical protein
MNVSTIAAARRPRLASFWLATELHLPGSFWNWFEHISTRSAS